MGEGAEGAVEIALPQLGPAKETQVVGTGEPLLPMVQPIPAEAAVVVLVP